MLYDKMPTIRRSFDKSLENINMKIQVLWNKIIFIFQYNLKLNALGPTMLKFFMLFIIRFVFLQNNYL